MREKTEQRINYLSNKYFKWLIILFIIIFFVFGYFFIIKPKYEQIIQSIQMQADLQSQDYLTKKDNLEKVKRIVSLYNQAESEKIKSVQTLLPTNPSHEKIFTVLDDMISKNGLILDEIKISIPSQEGEIEKGGGSTQEENLEIIDRDLPQQVKRVDINMSLMGVSYPGLKSFLTNLEDNLRLVDVASIDFVSDSGAVNLKLQTYFFDDKSFNIKRDIKL